MAIEKITYNGDSKVIKHICTVINAIIDSEGGGGSTASSVSYDNTVSGLTATDVQDAIDEVVSDIPDMTNVAYKNVNNAFTANQTIDRADGTTSNPGSSGLTIGNNIPNGTEGNSRASMRMYGNREYYVDIRARSITENRVIELPDNGGTFALTDDIPTDFVSKANGGTFGGNVRVDRADGTISTDGESTFYVGNATASGTAGNSRGRIRVYSNTEKYVDFRASDNQTANRAIYFPDKAGTLALDSDCLKVNILSATSSALTAYTYSIGGYFGEIYFSNMTGYDASLTSRTKFYVVTSCYLSTNSSVNGIATIRGSRDRVLINGNGAYTYYVEVAQIYV